MRKKIEVFNCLVLLREDKGLPRIVVYTPVSIGLIHT